MEQNKKPILFTIFLTVLIDLMGVCIVIPISAPLLLGTSSNILPHELSMHTKTIILGLLLGAFPFAQFFGAPILGTLSDRFGRKKILSIAIFGSCIGYLLFAYGIYTENIYILFFSRFLDGFTGGNISIINAAIADISEPSEKSKNFALVGAAFGLGMIFGPVIGGVLSNPAFHPSFSFITPYIFAAFLCLVNLILVLIYFQETLITKSDKKISAFVGFINIKAGLTDPILKWIFLIAFFYALGFNCYTQYFQVFMFRKFHFDQTQIAFYFTWVGICITLSQIFLVRKYNVKYAPEKVIKYSMILTGVSLLAMILPSNPLLILIITPFIATGQGFSYPNITNIISKNAIDGNQGKTLGIQHSIYACTMIMAPIIASFVDAINIHLPIILGSFFIVIAWLIYLMNRNSIAPI